jgi:MFS family permease
VTGSPSPARPDTDPPWPNPGYAWYVVVILLLAYTCSFIDRMILTLLVAPIRADLGISDTQMSLLVGFAFAVLYTLAGLPLGYLADRGNRKKLIMVGISLWSAMTAACGLAPNYALLFLARIGVGIGEATLSPAAYSLMSDYFPKDKLGRAVAVYSIGVPLGSGIALVLGGMIVTLATEAPAVSLPGIGEAAPWRLVFFLVGLPGLAIALLMMTVREPFRRGLSQAQQASSVRFRDAFAFVFTHGRTFVPLFAGLSLYALVMYGQMTWIPTFFARTYGMAPATAGFYYGIILAVSGAAGLILGGVLADYWFSKGKKDGHVLTILVAIVGSAPFLIFGPQMPTPLLAFVCIFIGQLISAMYAGVAGASLQIITPNRYRGQVIALYFFTANMIGFGIGPTAVAMITDFGFADDGALQHSLSLVATIILPIAIACILLSRAPFRRSVASLEAEGAALAT